MNSIEEKIAITLGALKIDSKAGNAREYIFDNKRACIKILSNTSIITVTYKMLERLDILILALKNEQNFFDFYIMSTADYKLFMTKGNDRRPPVGTMAISRFKKKGTLLTRINKSE